MTDVSDTQSPAAEIRERLGPPPDLDDWPSVSIVVLNRNGAADLRRLLAGLREHTDYPHFELIVVDNGSSDESVQLVRSAEAGFPISILANPNNESFSDANNRGAELAGGELLLFLNNDIEPFEPGWLRELIACLRRPEVGAVGATLITPGKVGEPVSEYLVQSRVARFRGSGDEISRDPGAGHRRLFEQGFGEDVDTTFAIGACILIERELFDRVGGFTRGYFYGGEDIDLFLKLNARGLRFRYSGRAVLIHGNSSTRNRELSGEEKRSLQEGNSQLLMSRWGGRLWREYELDRLAGGGIWAVPDQESPTAAPSREEVLALGFCLKADGASVEGAPELEELAAELRRRGHRCLVLRGEAIDEPHALTYDVVVHLRGPSRYVPNPDRLNVLWALGGAEGLTGVECGRYDLAVTGEAGLAERLRRDSGPTPVLVLDPEGRAGSLIEAAIARAVEIGLPTRIAPL
jgi:GT2 family glycosyltransferase